MKSLKNLFLLPIFAALFLIAGCAPNISPNAYNESNINSANPVIRGVIVSARPVQVNASNSGVGGLAGAVAGGAAGSAIGGGARANIIGGVGGALIGGLLGNEVQKGLSRQTGMEYIIRTNKGKLISVVQGSQTFLPVGQHVMVILGNPPKIIADAQ